MKTTRQDSVRRIESFFYSVSVMTIYVYIQDAREVLEKLEDPEDNVVDVAESRSLALFGMMESSSPVYSDVGKPRCQALGSS